MPRKGNTVHAWLFGWYRDGGRTTVNEQSRIHPPPSFFYCLFVKLVTMYNDWSVTQLENQLYIGICFCSSALWCYFSKHQWLLLIFLVIHVFMTKSTGNLHHEKEQKKMMTLLYLFTRGKSTIHGHHKQLIVTIWKRLGSFSTASTQHKIPGRHSWTTAYTEHAHLQCWWQQLKNAPRPKLPDFNQKYSMPA